MLQDHDFKYLLGLDMREFALGDEGGYMDEQGMDTLIRDLADMGEKFIPEMPEMLLGFYSYSCPNVIKGFAGCLLVLHSYGPIVNKGLESVSVFTLKHRLQLLQASVQVISLISIDVESFQVI